MAADSCGGIGKQQEAEKDFKAFLLRRGAGVGGFACGVESAFVGDSDTGRVVAYGVGADVGNVPHVVDDAVFSDVIMIAAFGEATAFVFGFEGGRG